MSSITAIATALPEFKYSTEELKRSLNQELPEESVNFLNRINSNSSINSRYLTVKLDQLIKISGNEQRSKLFLESTKNLGSKLLESFLKSNKIEPSSIRNIIFTSCTMPLVPSPETFLIQKFGLPSDVRRIPIFQHGCIGGAISISLANALAQHSGSVLIVSIESCSLLHDKSDHSPESLLGDSLFGDGAACAIVKPSDSGLSILDTKSYLIPNSESFLGYEIRDQATRVVLKKEIVPTIKETFPTLVKEFLNKNNLRIEEIDQWLVHPGGMKIIKAIEEALDISSEKTQHSWEVLEDYGNVSSAAIFFVIKKFLETAKPAQKACVVGVGPGMSMELILLEVKS